MNADVSKLKVYSSATAEEIARKAAAIVGGERAKQHGNKRDNFDNIAKLWTAWLRINHTLSKDLSGADVAKLMVLLKIARMESGAFNPDDSLDACGYAAIAGELARGEVQ